MSYYPEWWNINTHRCNHSGRAPGFQAPHGLGRSMVADWGRIGALKVHKTSDKPVEVIPQITSTLVGKLHSCDPSYPLLSPSSLSELKDSSTEEATTSTGSSSSSTQSGQPVGDPLVALRDFGFGHLLDDPIQGDQASAAFLCGKMLGLLKYNLTAFKQSGNNTSRTNKNQAQQVLDQLRQLTEQALDPTTCPSDRLAKLIQTMALLQPFQPFTPESSSTNVRGKKRGKRDRSDSPTISPLTNSFNPDGNDDDDLSNLSDHTIDLGDGDDTGGNLRKSGTRRSVMPTTFAKLFDYSNEDSRLLYAADPFLLNLTSRQVNPVFLGNGLLSVPSTCFTHNPSVKSQTTLVWSVPHQLKLNIARLSNVSLTHHSTIDLFNSPSLHDKVVAELDTRFDPSSSSANVLNAVVRLHCRSRRHPDCQNVIHLSLEPDEESQKYSIIASTSRPKLPCSATSVSLSPQLSDQWALCGSHVNSSKDVDAFVHLYSTCQQDRPLWSINVNMGQLSDLFRQSGREIDQAARLNSETTIDDQIYRLIDSLAPKRLNAIATSYPVIQHWPRVGFATQPGLLTLTTSKRLALLDTRQSNTSLLFALDKIDDNDHRVAQFSPADQLTYSSSTNWIDDRYALLGTLYNTVLIDPRMPLRSVLNWSHNLFGPLVYADWVEVDATSRFEFDLPRHFLCSASHQPSDHYSIIGLNTKPDSESQVVGPSMLAPSLAASFSRLASSASSQDDLASSENQQPTLSQLKQPLFTSSNCGLKCLPITSQSVDFVSLLASGDLFLHSCHFSAESAETTQQVNSSRVIDWLTELTDRFVSRDDDDNCMQEKEASVAQTTVDLSEALRLSDNDDPTDQHCPVMVDDDANHSSTNWLIDRLPPIDAFKPTSRTVAQTQHLVKDLWNLWDSTSEAEDQPRRQLTFQRLAEEQERQQNVDRLTLMSKQRLARLNRVFADASSIASSEADNRDDLVQDDDESLS